MSMPLVEKVIRAYVASYTNPDPTVMESLLDPRVIFYITNAQAGVDKVVGSQEFMKRIKAMNIPEATQFKINIIQIVTISEKQGMVMSEVKAEKNGKTLHNFSASLITIHNGKICESWMVDALPQYSDEFWLK